MLARRQEPASPSINLDQFIHRSDQSESKLPELPSTPHSAFSRLLSGKYDSPSPSINFDELNQYLTEKGKAKLTEMPQTQQSIYRKESPEAGISQFPASLSRMLSTKGLYNMPSPSINFEELDNFLAEKRGSPHAGRQFSDQTKLPVEPVPSSASPSQTSYSESESIHGRSRKLPELPSSRRNPKSPAAEESLASTNSVERRGQMGTSPSDKFFEFYRRMYPEKFPQMPQTGKEESASASEFLSKMPTGMYEPASPSINFEKLDQYLSQRGKSTLPEIPSTPQSEYQGLALYARLGDQRSEQFNWQIGRMEGRHNVPTQENAIDCGVFMLMFAADIVQQRSLHPVMGIRQSHVGQAREQIYRELLAFRYNAHIEPSGVIGTGETSRQSPLLLPIQRESSREMPKLPEKQKQTMPASLQSMLQSKGKTSLATTIRELPQLPISSQKIEMSAQSAFHKFTSKSTKSSHQTIMNPKRNELKLPQSLQELLPKSAPAATAIIAPDARSSQSNVQQKVQIRVGMKAEGKENVVDSKDLPDVYKRLQEEMRSSSGRHEKGDEQKMPPKRQSKTSKKKTMLPPLPVVAKRTETIVPYETDNLARDYARWNRMAQGQGGKQTSPQMGPAHGQTATMPVSLQKMLLAGSKKSEKEKKEKNAREDKQDDKQDKSKK